MRETYKSKSPLRGIVSSKYSKKEVHIKNHRKCIEIMSMSLEVAQYFTPDSIAVAYLLAKNVEREFLILRDSIQKESSPATVNSSHSRSTD